MEWQESRMTDLESQDTAQTARRYDAELQRMKQQLQQERHKLEAQLLQEKRSREAAEQQLLVAQAQQVSTFLLLQQTECQQPLLVAQAQQVSTGLLLQQREYQQLKPCASDQPIRDAWLQCHAAMAVLDRSRMPSMWASKLCMWAYMSVLQASVQLEKLISSMYTQPLLSYSQVARSPCTVLLHCAVCCLGQYV